MTEPSQATLAPSADQLRGPLLRYRIMAFVTGVMLLLLVFVAIPLKYAADSPGAVSVIGTAHGFLFIIYIITTLDLGMRSRWSLIRLGLIALAGTIPFMSFVAERWVHKQVEPMIEAERSAVG